MGLFVLFVKSGNEALALKEMDSIWSFDKTMRFIVPEYDARFRKGGKVYSETRKFMPGYVFIESDLSGMDFYILSNPLISWSKNILRLLRYGGSSLDDSFEMKQEEYQAFQQLLGKNNRVAMSKGVIEGDKTIITEGPLVGRENLIKKIDRHKMEASLELAVFEGITRTKVGLEIVSKNTNRRSR